MGKFVFMILCLVFLIAIAFLIECIVCKNKKENSPNFVFSRKLLYLCKVFQVYEPTDYIFENQFYSVGSYNSWKGNKSSELFMNMCNVVQKSKESKTRENFPVFFIAIDFLYETCIASPFLSDTEKRELLLAPLAEFNATVEFEEGRKYNKIKERKKQQKEDFEKLSTERFKELEVALKGRRGEL